MAEWNPQKIARLAGDLRLGQWVNGPVAWRVFYSAHGIGINFVAKRLFDQ